MIFASASASKAQPYAIAGDFNGWNNNGAISPGGGPNVYTNIMTGGTPGAFEGCKFIGVPGSWSVTYPSGNLEIKYDANGSNIVYFYPGSFNDGWEPQQNRVGFVDPGNMSFEIAGDFTSPNWGSDPNAQMVLQGNGVYTNTYIVATAGTHLFKFRTPGTWNDFNCGTDFGGGNPSNGSFNTTNANQPVLFQLDLPNGRWAAGTIPSKVTNQVVFAVDMTYQIQFGYFTPGSSVFVAGDFEGWTNTPQFALQLTNDPPYLGGSNTNIYYGTNTFVGFPGTVPTQYKFTQNDPNAQNSGWETSNNRSFALLTTNGTDLLPVAVFSDLYGADLLQAPVTLIFTINMTNAVTGHYADAHTFDPTNDIVVINGNFLSGGWSAWDPISMAGQIMTNNPVGSEIYEYDYTVPAGSPLEFQYKFGINYPGITNDLDNEAAAYVNHDRVVRMTSTGTYRFPLDTFGDMYTEPNFGLLTASNAVAGQVPLTWLGRPGVHLQTKADLSSGSWQDIIATDGTNWTTGYTSTNGFVSQTNWPATGGGKAFFRLIRL